MKHRLIKSVAVTGAAGLICLAGSPGYAATIVSQASANALTLLVAGSGDDSGTVVATNDGTGETKTGATEPLLGALDNNLLLNIGVLAQEAQALMDGLDGVSDACAGVAGEGASVVEIGDSSCINPGEPVTISIANLDLTDVVVLDPDSTIGEALAPLDPVLQALVADALAPITAQLTDALAPLGDLGLGGTLGAVQAVCHAVPGSATGSANIVDTTLSVTLPGQDPIIIANLPANPPPNTHVVTDLDVVLSTLLDAIRVQLETMLDGALAPLGAVVDPIEEQIVEGLIAQIAPQLAPLEDLIDITLNEQSFPAPGAIAVTALHLEVLGAAAEQLGAPLIDGRIGNVTCGPNSRLTATVPPGLPEIPTVVDSGAPGDNNGSGATLAGGLLLIAGAAAAMGYRRRQTL